jgi:hypothetical protein
MDNLDKNIFNFTATMLHLYFMFATLLQKLKISMKKTTLLFVCFSSIMIGLLTGCKDDEPTPENEEELITTVQLTFTPTGGGTAIVATWKDLDGDGGNSPDLSNASATLDANTSYNLAIELKNESVTPAEDITEEVEEESTEHLFLFDITTNLFSTFSYADTDGTHPVGLNTTLTTGNGTPATGTLKITLLHESNKANAGVTVGGTVKPKSAGSGGETDMEVDFEVNVL